MRYAKNSVVVQAERDIPLLRQVRNSKFVSHIQLFELMRFGGWEDSRDSFNWRVRRLLKANFLSVCAGTFGAGSAVYRISRDGVAMLEYHGQFTTVMHSRTEHLPHISQVFHSLELNRIQLALAPRTCLPTGNQKSKSRHSTPSRALHTRKTMTRLSMCGLETRKHALPWNTSTRSRAIGNTTGLEMHSRQSDRSVASCI